MSPETVLILIAANAFAALFLVFWFTLHYYTHRIEKIIKDHHRPSCAFIQAQQKRK